MKSPAAIANIPITKTVFGEEEMRAVQKPLETGWVVQGPYVAEFERKFSAYTGTRFSVAASSCTTALHIAVAALDLRPGEEVIVPAFTWVATANVVEYMGARPIFCDIDLATFNINTSQVEALISPRTVGLIPVHLFGLCADMAPLLRLAHQHSIWVVEDAACAFGGWYRGQHAGTFGNMGCFSFHPRKAITTGEGGMVTTASAETDLLLRSLRDHGASRSDLARHRDKESFLLSEYDRLGYNFRMTDIQGALGCAQMERADWIMRERRLRAEAYNEMLADIDWLQTPVVPQDYVHGYQAYVCLFRPEEPTIKNVQNLHDQRNRMMRRLEDQGIATRQGTHAAALQGFYRQKYNLTAERFSNAYFADRLSLALPLYPQMTDDDQDFVVSELKRAYTST